MTFIGTTAATSEVEQSGLRHMLQVTGRKLRQFVVFAHFVGQSGIGIEREIDGNAC